MSRPIFSVGGMALLLFLAACLSSSPTPMLTVTVTLTPTAMILPTASPEPSQTPTSLPTRTSSPTATFTPTYPLQPRVGVIIEQINARVLGQVAQEGRQWIRSHNAVSWAAVEPRAGVRNWASQADLEQELRDLSAWGVPTILSVRMTPSWAQLYPGYFCGPMKQEYFDEFASFMHDLVTRYRVPPYKVKYWEIWNEPDIDHALVAKDSGFGCWGDQNDPYYGGGYYATMLKFVYPQIKAADPQAQVLVGGLVLDCDPINPPAGKDCKPARFLEGILRNNGGPYFDGVSFHAYDYYLGALGQYSNSNWHSAWNTTGPVLSAKVAYLRQLLRQYGQSDKFLMNTETALLCGTSGEEPPCQTQELANTKAYYLVQSYTTALAADLHANLWYSLFGWRASGLLNPANLAPLPAFDAYRVAAKELHGARFVRQVRDYPGVIGYEFERQGRRLWVLWSLDGAQHSLVFPTVPQTVTDVFGKPLQVGSSVGVTVMPLYVEWKE